MSEIVPISFDIAFRMAKRNPSEAVVRVFGLDGLDKKKKGFTTGEEKKIAVLD
jgi:hypothetical protein